MAQKVHLKGINTVPRISKRQSTREGNGSGNEMRWEEDGFGADLEMSMLQHSFTASSSRC